MVLVELLTQQKPYAATFMAPVQIAIQVADGSLRPQAPPNCPPALAQLLDSIFSADPLERPSFGLIVAHLERALHEVRLSVAAAQTESAFGGGLGRFFKAAAAAVPAPRPA